MTAPSPYERLMPAFTAYQSRTLVRNFGGFNVVRSFADLLVANSGDSDIAINTDIVLTANITITKPLWMLEGGTITTNGYTLTINAPFNCGAVQCFAASAGQVVFGTATPRVFMPEWFGAIGDGSTDDSAAIQLALNIAGSYSIIKFSPKKVYKVSSTLTIPITVDYMTLDGYGSTIYGAVNGNILKISDTSTTNDHATYISILGLEILGFGSANSTYPLQNGIEIDAIIGCVLRDVIIREIPQTGIVGTKSTASGSTYWNKVVFDNVQVHHCGAQTIKIGTASAVDDLTMIGCLLNHGGCQIATNSANGSAYINAISLSMSGCEISGNYSSTTAGAGYRWGLQIQAANGMISGCHFELNCNDQAGSGDLMLDTTTKCISVVGCEFYSSDVTGAKFAIQDYGTSNRFECIGWASSVTHAYDYILELSSSTDSRVGIVTSLNSPVVGPNTAIINASSTTIIERIVLKAVTASRPTPLSCEIGRLFLDTTLDADGKPIWWNGTAWVDATGAVV